MSRFFLLAELWQFICIRKRWVLLPIIVILLLLSQSFTASRWCRDEAVWALDRHNVGTARVISAHLETVIGWEDISVRGVRLGGLQSTPLDSNRRLRPVSRWKPQSEAYAAVAK